MRCNDFFFFFWWGMRCNNLQKKKEKKDGLNKRAIESVTCQNLMLFRMKSSLLLYIYIYILIWFLNNLNKYYQKLQQLFRFYLLQVTLSFLLFSFVYHWLSLSSYLPWLPSIYSLSTYPWVNVIWDSKVFDDGFQTRGFVLELTPWKRILVRTLFSFFFFGNLRHFFIWTYASFYRNLVVDVVVFFFFIFSFFFNRNLRLFFKPMLLPLITCLLLGLVFLHYSHFLKQYFLFS